MSQRKVLEVKDVELSILRGNPPRLNIIAHGTVPTPGWTEAELSAYVYVTPPPDGIYDFDFVAKPSEKMAVQVIAPIVGAHIIENIPSGLRGVRVHAASNIKEVLLGERGRKTKDNLRHESSD
jgi:hypothetical protein